VVSIACLSANTGGSVLKFPSSTTHALTLLCCQRSKNPIYGGINGDTPCSRHHAGAKHGRQRKPTATPTATSRFLKFSGFDSNALKGAYLLVPGGGLEPPRPCGLRILSAIGYRPPASTKLYLFDFHSEVCPPCSMVSIEIHRRSHQISHQSVAELRSALASPGRGNQALFNAISPTTNYARMR
jgi:hypothetical protein